MSDQTELMPIFALRCPDKEGQHEGSVRGYQPTEELDKGLVSFFTASLPLRSLCTWVKACDREYAGVHE